MALQLPVIHSAPDGHHMAEPRIRRCTYRRLVQVETATPICNSCTAAHIFRPDED